MNCDQCGRPSTVHITEIIGNRKRQRHLCTQCGAKAGFPIDQQKVHEQIKALAVMVFLKEHGREPTDEEMRQFIDEFRREQPGLLDDSDG